MGTSTFSRKYLVFLAGLAVCVLLFSSGVHCQDPDQLQDFCVAVLNSQPTASATTSPEADPANATRMGIASNVAFNETQVFNFKCKSPVTAQDFVFTELAHFTTTPIPTIGSKVTFAFVTQFPAVNTLGIAMARIDFVKNGVNPPHEHPRGTELLYMLNGSLLVGFIDTNNRIFQSTLKQGDMFVFPVGLIHFQIEVGEGPASFLANFDSQNPGRQDVVASLLGADPPVPTEVVEAAFGINATTYNTIVQGFEEMS